MIFRLPHWLFSPFFTGRSSVETSPGSRAGFFKMQTHNGGFVLCLLCFAGIAASVCREGRGKQQAKLWKIVSGSKSAGQALTSEVEVSSS